MGQKIDLSTPRTLHIVENIDGFATLVLNREETQSLKKQVMSFHLMMMLAFITVIGAPFAWLAAAANILLSPKVASKRITCTQYGVQQDFLYSRSELGVKGVTSDDGIIGPKVWGTGDRPEPVNIPFSEIVDMGWNTYEIWFQLRDNQRINITMELTNPEDITRLGERIKESWKALKTGISAEEADQQRNQLAALVGQMNQG